MMFRTFIQGLLLISVLFACHSNRSEKIVIATAANAQYAMNDIVEAFTKTTQIECELVISSSGKLTAQIIEGAPFDILVSADLKYPQEIFDKGLATDPPKIYALGSLVLWTLNEDLELSFDELTNEKIAHIAIANPKTAPYGKASVELLEKMGILTDVESKLVYGESISQVNQFVLSGSADVGFTPKSIVLSPELPDKGKWRELDPSLYNPIQQGVVLIDNENKEKARKFYDFLFSGVATDILVKYGYNKPPVE